MGGGAFQAFPLATPLIRSHHSLREEEVRTARLINENYEGEESHYSKVLLFDGKKGELGNIEGEYRRGI